MPGVPPLGTEEHESMIMDVQPEGQNVRDKGPYPDAELPTAWRGTMGTSGPIQ